MRIGISQPFSRVGICVNFEDYVHLLFRFITGEAKYPSSEDSVRPSVWSENRENM